ncbi:MAG: cytochrome c1 [Mariprofundaceae bacterium]
MKGKHMMAVLAGLLAATFAAPAMASEGHGVELKHAEIDVTDQAQLRRGLTVFTDVCMGCHSAKYITYKNLMDYPELGLSREEVDELRGDKPLTSGLITDLAPEDAKVSYGKVPPDLSLIANGRRGGADYIYSLLTGFEHDPAGKIPDGNYNRYFPGNRIAMPDPLAWLDHDEADTAQLERDAQDVAAFLSFVADPHQNERRSLGVWVVGFFLLLTVVLYLLKKEVWRDVH